MYTNNTYIKMIYFVCFFFQAEDGIRDGHVTGVQTCALPISSSFKTLYEAVVLNEEVKQAVESMIELDEIRGLNLNSDYNFTDLSTKEYRYQAVYDIRYY